MKKFNILVFCILLILSGCSNNLKKNDLERMDLNGPIKSVKETSYKANLKFGEYVKGERERYGYNKDLYIIFNKKGFGVEKNEYESDGDLWEKIKYKYNNKNNLIERNKYWSDGDLLSKNKYEYNVNGDIINAKRYTESKGNLKLQFFSKFETNDESKKTKEIRYNPDSSIINKWQFQYVNGNLTKLSSYDSKNNITAKYIYTYGANDNMLMEKIYYENSGGLELNNKLIYEYNDEGNMISKVVYTSDDKIENRIKYQYLEYDKYNNWLRKLTLISDTSDYILEREIKYYK